MTEREQLIEQVAQQIHEWAVEGVEGPSCDEIAEIVIMTVLGAAQSTVRALEEHGPYDIRGLRRIRRDYGDVLEAIANLDIPRLI